MGLAAGEVFFATLTGKAAHVLRKNSGVPAQTIHSLIYHYSGASERLIAKLEDEIAELEGQYLKASSAKKILIRGEIKAKQEQLKNLKKPRFTLNENSALANAKLLVLDECSMIDKQTATDLLSFGVPILLLGDPGQLPPIKGDAAGGFGNAKPDVFLTEIHRQAEDSAIIRLATMARQGQHIPYGQYSEQVLKIPRGQLGAEDLLRFDQVICGLNKTRINLNNEMREAKGFGGSVLPVGPQEKVIALRNENGCGILNGEFIKLSGATKADEWRFFAEVENSEGNSLGIKRCYSGHFLDHREYDKQRVQNDWKIIRQLTETTFGYCITCHKAQGSGFESVALIDDGWGRGRSGDRKRWLYTGITRCANVLIIIG